MGGRASCSHQNNYPISVTYNGITYTWADIGPTAPCPFDTSNNGSPRPSNGSTVKPYGFSCMDRPATLSGATDLSQVSSNRYLIPSSGTYAGMICPSVDSGAKFPGKTNVFYNGCYTSAVDQTIVLTSGSGASCPAGRPIANAAAAAAADNASRRPISITGATIRQMPLKLRQQLPRTAPGPAASTIAIRITTPRTAHPEQAAEPRPRNSMQSNGRAAFRPRCLQ